MVYTNFGLNIESTIFDQRYWQTTYSPKALLATDCLSHRLQDFVVFVVHWLEHPSVEPEVSGLILTGGSVPSGWNVFSTYNYIIYIRGLYPLTTHFSPLRRLIWVHWNARFRIKWHGLVLKTSTKASGIGVYIED